MHVLFIDILVTLCTLWPDNTDDTRSDRCTDKTKWSYGTVIFIYGAKKFHRTVQPFPNYEFIFLIVRYSYKEVWYISSGLYGSAISLSWP